MVLRDVVDIKDALVAAVMEDEWEEASGTSANAGDVAAHARDARFWRNAKALLLLVRPVMDAIHQLEGDSPRLSQVCNNAREGGWLGGLVNAHLPSQEAVHSSDKLLPLPQMLAIWETLVDHGKAFQLAEHITAAQKRDCDMGKLFAARAESCYHQSFPLAYLLDPVHMQRDGDNWDAPFINVSAVLRGRGGDAAVHGMLACNLHSANAQLALR